MHTPPLQKLILGIKGKIRGVYAVKILHIWQEIFIFYAVLADGRVYTKKRQESQPAGANNEPPAGRQILPLILINSPVSGNT